MSKIERLKHNLTSITLIQKSTDEPVILEISPTGIAVLSGIVTQIKYSLHRKRATDKQQPVNDIVSPVERRIKDTIKSIFAVTDLEQITIPVYRLWRDYIVDYDRISIMQALHKMGYRSKSGRHRYPNIYPSFSENSLNTDGNAEESLSQKSKYEMVRANTTYYQFEKSDFIY